ncbi:MAG TPA: twin-arginine translocation signal domain-containing protein [Thermomicrobiales bacterium]|nr:twin-arginine translocation signal domain-containing protein [Thermomicrobiales bacterium]
MSLHRSELVTANTGSRGLSRRRFLQMVGAATGRAVMNVMAVWGQIPISAQISPPPLDGNGNGTKVIVVGAGPGGCPAA